MPTDRDGPTTLLLPDHHQEIENACSALLACAYCDDSRDLVCRYRALEHAVLEHLAAEEETMLGAYATHSPADGIALFDQHTEIRKQLFALGVEVELHTVRAETLERLIQVLRAHAAQEDATMYRWAQLHLPLQTKRQLFARISHSMRELARSPRQNAAVETAQPREP